MKTKQSVLTLRKKTIKKLTLSQATGIRGGGGPDKGDYTLRICNGKERPTKQLC